MNAFYIPLQICNIFWTILLIRQACHQVHRGAIQGLFFLSFNCFSDIVVICFLSCFPFYICFNRLYLYFFQGFPACKTTQPSIPQLLIIKINIYVRAEDLFLFDLRIAYLLNLDLGCLIPNKIYILFLNDFPLCNTIHADYW